MKLFICKSHAGFWLQGCSVVIAKDIEAARQLLDNALVERGLKPSEDKYSEQPYQLEEIPTNVPNVFVLFDGDY